jgi:hypothetical protein
MYKKRRSKSRRKSRVGAKRKSSRRVARKSSPRGSRMSARRQTSRRFSRKNSVVRMRFDPFGEEFKFNPYYGLRPDKYALHNDDYATDSAHLFYNIVQVVESYIRMFIAKCVREGHIIIQLRTIRDEVHNIKNNLIETYRNEKILLQDNYTKDDKTLTAIIRGDLDETKIQRKIVEELTAVGINGKNFVIQW